MSTLIAVTGDTKHSATPSTFDLWAEVYDTQVNPFLSLEERILKSLLPDLQGLDVLDAGCGTGRMLGILKACNARHVIGVDSSHAMLERARSMHDADVRHGFCTDLPVDDVSIDCVISSFVLSYIANLEAFADEIRRITRPGAKVLLSDMHPATAQALNWRRSFRSSGHEIEVASEGWQIGQIRDVFASRGFRIGACVEPGFSSPERNIFAQARRTSSFVRMQSLPAIYILEFIRDADIPETTGITFAWANTHYALTPVDTSPTNITMFNGKIAQLNNDYQAQATGVSTLDLSGYLVLPGLINAHDHLEFGLFPRLGRGPYGNAAQWAEDIHFKDVAIIARHRSIPRAARIVWGAIRNLLAGVTTVCHHNPLTPEMLDPEFPVAVVQNFEWAHSLAMDENLAAKFEAAGVDQPFIVHAAEGVDAQSSAEFQRLTEQGAITPRTVLVHGIAIPPDSVAALNDCGVALVTCPSSNEFLFDRLPSPGLLAGVKKIALGSDSPLTAEGDLLDELRFAQIHTGLHEEELYRMVTTAPAEILRLKRGEGRLAPGSTADFIATKHRGLTPAATLTSMSSQDIELVVREGRIFLVSDALFQQLPESARAGLELLIVDGQPRWIRAPLARLFCEAAPVMDRNTLSLAGKKVTHGYST